MTSDSDGRVIMNATEMARAFSRMAHEIIERNDGADDLLLCGIPTRGVHLAARLSQLVAQFEGQCPPSAVIDPTPFRDDAAAGTGPRLDVADLGVGDSLEALDVNGVRAVIVDDVFNTGRTARAAMDALMHAGRPSRVQLAVLINRGHRELPISPDFVGKNIPTARAEWVNVRLAEVDRTDSVSLGRQANGRSAS